MFFGAERPYGEGVAAPVPGRQLCPAAARHVYVPIHLGPLPSDAHRHLLRDECYSDRVRTPRRGTPTSWMTGEVGTTRCSPFFASYWFSLSASRVAKIRKSRGRSEVRRIGSTGRVCAISKNASRRRPPSSITRAFANRFAAPPWRMPTKRATEDLRGVCAPADRSSQTVLSAIAPLRWVE